MIHRYEKLLEEQKAKLRYMVDAGVPENNATRIALVMSIKRAEEELRRATEDDWRSP